MSYLKIRGLLESSTTNVLVAAGLSEIFYDNVAHAQPDASTTYAEIAISFAGVKVDTIGCPGNDSVSGTITAYIYVPANTGSATGEDLSLEVLRTWSNLGFTPIDASSPYADTKIYLNSLDGPRSIANDEGAVHQLFVVTAGFTGRYTGA